MSSTMSTLRMPSHTLSPSTSPNRPTRMSTTPKICANRLSTISDEPPRVLHGCLVTKYTSWATWWMHLFLAFIHPRAWKVHSPTFYTKICIAPVSSVTDHRRLMYVPILAQLSKHEVRDVLPRYSGGFISISAEKDLVLTRGTLVSDPGWAHDHPL